MSFTEIVFYIFIAFTVLPAFSILFTKNVLYAAFLLLMTFMGISGLYVFAQADFIAVAQLMIYVGGILVLIVFGVMLTNRIAGTREVITENRNVFAGILIGSIVFIALFIGILKANFSAIAWINAKSGKLPGNTTLTTIGENLMTNFVLPFEVAAILLMVALMGAAFIASQLIKKNKV